jgi:hypothetical protein
VRISYYNEVKWDYPSEVLRLRTLSSEAFLHSEQNIPLIWIFTANMAIWIYVLHEMKYLQYAAAMIKNFTNDFLHAPIDLLVWSLRLFFYWSLIRILCVLCSSIFDMWNIWSWVANYKQTNNSYNSPWQGNYVQRLQPKHPIWTRTRSKVMVNAKIAELSVLVTGCARTRDFPKIVILPI